MAAQVRPVRALLGQHLVTPALAEPPSLILVYDDLHGQSLLELSRSFSCWLVLLHHVTRVHICVSTARGLVIPRKVIILIVRVRYFLHSCLRLNNIGCRLLYLFISLIYLLNRQVDHASQGLITPALPLSSKLLTCDPFEPLHHPLLEINAPKNKLLRFFVQVDLHRVDIDLPNRLHHYFKNITEEL